MSQDLTSIQAELTEAGELLRQTYSLVKDLRYKKGMELIESTYQTFLNGSHNLDGTLEVLTYYMTELETLANDNFRPERIGLYLRAISGSQGPETARNCSGHILTVRAKYLQMVTAFYIYRNEQT